MTSCYVHIYIHGSLMLLDMCADCTAIMAHSILEQWSRILLLALIIILRFAPISPILHYPFSFIS